MSGITIIPLKGRFPKVANLIEVCHDNKETVWLQLTNSDFIVGGDTRGKFVTVLIGAVNRANAWAPIDAGTAAGRRAATIPLHIPWGSASKFQKAIIDHWKNFNSGRAKEWAKGTTFGTSLTSASFVMKALKTGFDAINQPMSAYSGIRVTDFTLKDVLDYLNSRLHFQHVGAPFDGAVMPDLEFEAITPAPKYLPPYTQDPPSKRDRRKIDYIHSVKATGHSGTFAYMDEATGIPYERVIAYGFRGDTRPPSALRLGGDGFGGFGPNYTRPDHIIRAMAKSAPAQAQATAIKNELDAIKKDAMKKGKNLQAGAEGMKEVMKELKLQALGKAKQKEADDVHSQALNLKKYIAHQEYGGFISSTKSVAVAKEFATGYAEGKNKAGWVYVVFIEGGFHFPLMGSKPLPNNAHTWLKFDEQEIAMPGLLDWDDIVGCRHIQSNGSFDGNVYLKHTLIEDDPLAAMEIWDLLSGRSQGPGL